MGKFQRSINSHIFWGISGALTTVLLFHLYAWMFTLGSTALQLFEGWLILLPVALTIGAVAGVLSWALTPNSQVLHQVLLSQQQLSEFSIRFPKPLTT